MCRRNHYLKLNKLFIKPYFISSIFWIQNEELKISAFQMRHWFNDEFKFLCFAFSIQTKVHCIINLFQFERFCAELKWKFNFTEHFLKTGNFLKQFSFTRAYNDDIFADLLQRGGCYCWVLENGIILNKWNAST